VDVEADIADIYRIIEIEAAIAQLKVDPVGMRSALVVILYGEQWVAQPIFWQLLRRVALVGAAPIGSLATRWWWVSARLSASASATTPKLRA
jgi:hypothetical protein